jgi:hypothetical protein
MPHVLKSLGALLLLTLIGGLLIALYGYTARQRWGADISDFVQAFAYRMEVDRSWPAREQLLHALLYMLKWLGMVMFAMGLGVAVAGLVCDRSLLR